MHDDVVEDAACIVDTVLTLLVVNRRERCYECRKCLEIVEENRMMLMAI